MTSAALTQSGTPETGEGALNLFLRAVWARLASGALLAALAAWSLAMVPFCALCFLSKRRGSRSGSVCWGWRSLRRRSSFGRLSVSSRAVPIF